jgi:hypothetical protein
VVTNTTSNTIAVVSGVGELRNADWGLRIYPNPAKDEFVVEVGEEMVGGGVRVSDVTGRKIIEVKIKDRSSKIKVEDLAGGIYFVTVEKGKNKVSRKLVISK